MGIFYCYRAQYTVFLIFAVLLPYFVYDIQSKIENVAFLEPF